MSILELKHVTYTYESMGRKMNAVQNADFAFQEQKLYVIIGKSGSGKSTLLSMISGMKTPVEGAILYQGQELCEKNMEEYRRNDIALIHQAYHLFPRLSALENVCYPMDLKKIPRKEVRERAIEKLKSVGLSEQNMHRYPGHLSGGEQQRVAVARALGKDAKILLADEPTGNLDHENTVIIMELLKKLASEGYCIIIVTHDKEVTEMADCVLEMSEGVLTVSDDTGK